MKEEIRKRALKHAWLFLEREATIRSVEDKTGFSRSTIHRDIAIRLEQFHPELAAKVREKLSFHKSARLIRANVAKKKANKKNKK